jgi:hypothetical protein
VLYIKKGSLKFVASFELLQEKQNEGHRLHWMLFSSKVVGNFLARIKITVDVLMECTGCYVQKDFCIAKC